MNVPNSETKREEISHTRSRMDDTIDALASRLNGRHLVDEVLGYFRSGRSNGNGSGNGSAIHAAERVSDSASTAVRAIAGAIREHPLPAALIGSGIAWMVYEHYRDDEEDYRNESPLEDDPAQQRFFEEESYAPGKFGSEDEASRFERLREEALESGSHLREGVAGMASTAKEKLSGARSQWGARSGHASEQARGRIRGIRRGARNTGRRARQASAQVRHGARDVLHQGRDQLDRHPLEAGLISLAGGLIAGLLTPNPDEFDEWAAPTARRMEDAVRQRAGEALERGKHVASVAAETAQRAAAEQGLTPNALKEGAESVLRETRHAAEETVREEAEAQGLTPGSITEKAQAVMEETKDSMREAAHEDQGGGGARSSGEFSSPGQPEKPGL